MRGTAAHVAAEAHWSKAGGYSPICYKKEVTKDMVKEWRQQNR
jgi:hypothetical protein